MAGGLWLHSMPGRHEPLEQAWAQVLIHGVQTIVCPAASDEVLATCVLLGLGHTEADARQAISAAGSHPETPEQRALVSWWAAQARGAERGP
jgi:hypothetical protein